jgi:hypothetical protein
LGTIGLLKDWVFGKRPIYVSIDILVPAAQIPRGEEE